MKTLFTRRYQLVAWLGLLISLPSLAQELPPFSCGTDEITTKRLATDKLYRDFVDSVKPKKNKSGEDTTTVYTVPVAFVVYHLGEPVGAGSNVSEEALEVQLDIMNRMFAGQRPKFMGPNANIRFVLARQSFDCGAFGGVARVDARSVPGYEANGLDVGDGTKAQQLRNLLPQFAATNTNEFLIVRVMHRVTGNGGWAFYGGEVTVPANSMNNVSLSNTLLTHEVGHSLLLQHTFGGSNQLAPNQYQCPYNTNPLNQGDLVADTDPHQQNEPRNSCDPSSELAINGCTGRPFGLIGRNFMSYGCDLKLFTRGQIDRMRSYLVTNAQNLINSPYRTPTQGDVKLMCIPAGFQPTVLYRKGITSVQFQTIKRETNVDPTGHRLYHDYTCSDRTTVTAGQSYSLVVEGIGKHRRVYIDYNNDGEFDETLEVAWASVNGTAGRITIPANAATNTYVRMRVIVDDGTLSPSPCSLPGNPVEGPGEVQDFAILVLPANTPVSLSVGAIPTGYLCKGKPVFVPVIPSGAFEADNQFTVQLSNSSGSFDAPVAIGSGADGPVSVTVPASAGPGSGYRVRVVSSNPVLVSENSPLLTIDNFPTATISGSQTLAAGQLGQIQVVSTGVDSRYVEITRNGLPWQVIPNIAETSTADVRVTSSTVYQLATVRNPCGVGTAFGSAMITVPCSTPTNLVEILIAPGQVQAYWTFAEGSTYTLQWKETSANTWQQYANIANNGQLISGLDETKTYVWRVKRNCIDGESGWSEERTMVFGCQLSTELQSANFDPGKVRLFWSYGGPSATYTLRYRVRDTPNWTEVTNLSSTNYVLTNVPGNVTYEWQMKTQCTSNIETAYSALQQFSTNCGYPNYSGGTAVFPDKVVVGWLSNNALNYQVRWKPVNSFDWIVSDTTTAGTYANLRNLQGDTFYEWQVRANCSANQTSHFSTSNYFTTLCPEPASLTVTDVASTSAGLLWSGSPNATYALRWRVVGAANWNTVPSVLAVSYMLTGLSSNTAYEYQVQTKCTSGTSSAYSASFSFTTPCTVPILYGQYINSTMASLSFGGIAPYQVRWRAVGNATWTESSTLNSGLYQLTNLSYGESYEWQVRSFCSPGNSSAYSVSSQFLLACPVPGNPVVSNVGSSTARLSWSGTAGESYQLRWRAVGAAEWTTVSSLTAGVYNLTGLTTNTTYEWQVSRICSATLNSTHTNSLTFTPRCTLVLFMSEVAISGVSALLQWYLPVNNLPYVFQWRPVGNPTWQSSTTLVYNSYDRYRLSGLTNGITYEWRVLTECEGVLTPSVSRTFTTQCGPLAAGSVTAGYVTSNSAYLQWNSYNFPPDVTYRVRYRPISTGNWTEQGIPATFSTISLTGLTNNTTYEWQMQMVCGGMGGAYAATAPPFTTTCLVATLYVPQPGDTSVQLNWSSYTGQNVELDYRVIGAPDWTVVTSLTAGSYLLTTTTSTAYEWRIRTICNENAALVSNTGSFTTLPACDPLEPNNSAPTATTVSGNSFTTVVLCINRAYDEDWFRWDINGETYYLAVKNFGSSSPSAYGEYILTGQINNGVLNAATQSANGSTTDTFLALYAADGQTIRASNNDVGGTPYSYFSQISYTLPAPCPVMTTVKNGSWTDPTVWSCNRTPVATDAVQVLHHILMYGSSTSRASRISYGIGGKLIMSPGVRLMLGQ